MRAIMYHNFTREIMANGNYWIKLVLTIKLLMYLLIKIDWLF